MIKEQRTILKKINIDHYSSLIENLSRQKPKLDQKYPRHHNPSVPPDQKTEALQEQQDKNGQSNENTLAETDPNVDIDHFVFGKSPAQPKQKKRGNPRYEKK